MAHVGVIKTLVAAGIPIDYVAGASIGAFVGACYALHRDGAILEEKTLGYRRDKLFAFIEPTWRGGLSKGKRAGRLLHKLFGEATFADLQIPLSVVTTDLVSGHEYVFNSGNLAFAVQASMAIPGVFCPLPFGDKLLVDGGMLNPLPVDVVRAMGADVVVAVDLDNASALQYGAGKMSRSALASVMRAFDIRRYQLGRSCAARADVVIEPDFSGVGFQILKGYFLEKREHEFVALGEQAAQEKMRDIISRINI